MDPEEFIISAFSKRNTGNNMFMPENHEYEEPVYDPEQEKNGYDEESNDDPLMNIGEDPSFFQDDMDEEDSSFENCEDEEEPDAIEPISPEDETTSLGNHGEQVNDEDSLFALQEGDEFSDDEKSNIEKDCARSTPKPKPRPKPRPKQSSPLKRKRNKPSLSKTPENALKRKRNSESKTESKPTTTKKQKFTKTEPPLNKSTSQKRKRDLTTDSIKPTATPPQNKRKKKTINVEQTVANYKTRIQKECTDFKQFHDVYLTDFGIKKHLVNAPQCVEIPHHATILEQLVREKGFQIKGFADENKKQGKYTDPIPPGEKRFYIGKENRFTGHEKSPFSLNKEDIVYA